MERVQASGSGPASERGCVFYEGAEGVGRGSEFENWVAVRNNKKQIRMPAGPAVLQVFLFFSHPIVYPIRSG